MMNIKHVKALCLCGAAIVGLAAALAACKNPLTQEVRQLAAVAASPKMAIAVANSTATAIANGASYDFGTVGINDATPYAEVSFTATNSGKVALAISSSGFSGANAGCFSFSTPPPASLSPAASATFTIRFTPGTSGAKTAKAVLVTNDVSNTSFSFTLTGTGIDSAPVPVFVENSTTTYTSGSVLCVPGGLDSIEIKCSNSNATIYYTEDGPTPNTKYTVPLSPAWSGNTIIQAYAAVPGMKDSSVATLTLTTTTVSTPTIIVADRSFSPSDALASFPFSISSPTNNAKIAFTIDGSPPIIGGATLLTSPTSPPVSVDGVTYMMTNGSSFIYQGQHINGSFTLKAVAFVSAVSSPSSAPATYTFQLSPPTWATVQPSATYYVGAQSVGLSAASGAGGTVSILYSTDGSAPSSTYGGPIVVPVGAAGSSTSEVIKAVAHQANWVDSTPSISGVFHVCGPGLWCDGGSNSNWDQATWQP